VGGFVVDMRSAKSLIYTSLSLILTSLCWGANYVFCFHTVKTQ